MSAERPTDTEPPAEPIEGSTTQPIEGSTTEPIEGSTTEPIEGYAAAVVELEAILTELEDDQIDVDHLAERVRRASELIRFCRDRIGATRVEVERIVAGLEDLDDPPAG